MGWLAYRGIEEARDPRFTGSIDSSAPMRRSESPAVGGGQRPEGHDPAASWTRLDPPLRGECQRDKSGQLIRSDIAE